jgi:hypothetical protein
VSEGTGLTHPLPQHINELTMKLSVEDVLTRAEALYRQLTACPVSAPQSPPVLHSPHPPPLPAFSNSLLTPPGAAPQRAGGPGSRAALRAPQPLAPRLPAAAVAHAGPADPGGYSAAARQ